MANNSLKDITYENVISAGTANSLMVQYERGKAAPMDITDVFETVEGAGKYALTGNNSYVGKVLSVVGGEKVDVYKIDKDSSIKRLVDEDDIANLGGGSDFEDDIIALGVASGAIKTEVSALTKTVEDNHKAITDATTGLVATISAATYNVAYEDAVESANTIVDNFKNDDYTPFKTTVSKFMGTDSGSTARAIAAEEVAKIVASNGDDKLDTIEEIAAYIASDITSAASLVAKVDALQNSAHTHTNLDTLESIKDVDITNWRTSVGMAHVHNNADILCGITSSDIERWNTIPENVLTVDENNVLNRKDLKVGGLEIVTGEYHFTMYIPYWRHNNTGEEFFNGVAEATGNYEPWYDGYYNEDDEWVRTVDYTRMGMEFRLVSVESYNEEYETPIGTLFYTMAKGREIDGKTYVDDCTTVWSTEDDWSDYVEGEVYITKELITTYAVEQTSAYLNGQEVALKSEVPSLSKVVMRDENGIVDELKVENIQTSGLSVDIYKLHPDADDESCYNETTLDVNDNISAKVYDSKYEYSKLTEIELTKENAIISSRENGEGETYISEIKVGYSNGIELNAETVTINGKAIATTDQIPKNVIKEITINNVVKTGTSVNLGTVVTGVKINGTTKTGATPDLGTFLTSHQDISGKADRADLETLNNEVQELKNRPSVSESLYYATSDEEGIVYSGSVKFDLAQINNDGTNQLELNVSTPSNFDGMACFNNDIHMCNGDDELGGTIYFGKHLHNDDGNNLPYAFISEREFGGKLDIYGNGGIDLTANSGSFDDNEQTYAKVILTDRQLGIKFHLHPGDDSYLAGSTIAHTIDCDGMHLDGKLTTDNIEVKQNIDLDGKLTANHIDAPNILDTVIVNGETKSASGNTIDLGDITSATTSVSALTAESANTSENAIKDGEGNVIADTYLTKEDLKGGIRFAGVVNSSVLPELYYDDMEDDPIITGKWPIEEGFEERIFKIGDIIILVSNVDGYADEPTAEYILIRDNDYQIKWIELGNIEPAQEMIDLSLRNYYDKSATDEKFQLKNQAIASARTSASATTVPASGIIGKLSNSNMPDTLSVNTVSSSTISTTRISFESSGTSIAASIGFDEYETFTIRSNDGVKIMGDSGESLQINGGDVYFSDNNRYYSIMPRLHSDSTTTRYLIGSTLYDNETRITETELFVSPAIYTNGVNIFATSDDLLKDVVKNIECNLDDLAKLPKFNFTWKNDESKKIDLGTSAQKLREIYPELVTEDPDGRLGVAYDKLSIVALAAIDKLHKENLELKERLRRIEEKLGL